MVPISVGHIGYHTLGLAAKYPSFKVVVFEPNPANVERLEEARGNERHGGRCIEIRPVALSDGNGNAVFNLSSNIDDQTSSGSYLQDGGPPAGRAIMSGRDSYATGSSGTSVG
ncbi:MAG: FkbM family methyltransferase [Flavobacteriales bacterium]|nr:FkbM family methyltransferase [Flavobacteriales bacterium]